MNLVFFTQSMPGFSHWEQCPIYPLTITIIHYLYSIKNQYNQWLHFIDTWALMPYCIWCSNVL